MDDIENDNDAFRPTRWKIERATTPPSTTTATITKIRQELDFETEEGKDAPEKKTNEADPLEGRVSEGGTAKHRI